MSAATEVGKMLEAIAKAIVDHPEDVRVEEVGRERTLVLELHLHSRDIGQVIGKKGQLAMAIRKLVTAAGAKQRKLAVVEIIEPGRPPFM